MSKKASNGIIAEIIETGSEISGSTSGALIGLLAAGAEGAIWGGIAGPVITKVFKTIGKEIKERVFGQREEVRVGAAYTFAIQKIRENAAEGKVLRGDDFFKQQDEQRPFSEETLEGIVLSAQREFEELKLKHLGNLYANVSFNENVSKAHCIQLIKTVDELSFRQLCLLQLFREKRQEDEQRLFPKLRGLEIPSITEFDMISEIRSLNQRGLLFIPATLDGGDNAAPIPLDRINITKSGMFFCEILSLETIERKHLENIKVEMRINE